MRSFALLLTMGLVLCAASNADQQAWIGRAAADRAAALLPSGTEIRHFCAPCGDVTWTAETVSTVEVRSTGSDDSYEVAVNDTGIDLAYVYVQLEGKWANLAQHLGLEVSDVPEVLPDPGGDFGQTWYSGVLGEKAIFMELVKTGAEVGGTYAYAHVGLPIEINGTVNEDGALAITEFAEGKRTGLFVGKLDAKAGVWSGKWLNPDGSREFPFEVRRLAVLAEESRNATAGGQNVEAILTFPFFLGQAGNQAELVNQVLRADIEDAWTGVLADWAAQVDYSIANPPEEGAFTATYSLEISPGAILHYGPGLVTFTCNISTYTGGAHGMYYVQAYNLLIEGGQTKQLTLADLFKPDSGYVEALSRFCLDELKKKEASNIVDGAITALTADQHSSFAVSRAGITVFFAPYAVASYAEGAFEVTVPWDIVAPMLRPNLLQQLSAPPAFPKGSPEEEAKG